MVELRNPSPVSLNEHIIGAGYGGNCFPKDVQALAHTTSAQGQALRMLVAVNALNHDQKHVVINKKVLAKFSRNLAGKIFALWGLAFKLKTYPSYSAR